MTESSPLPTDSSTPRIYSRSEHQISRHSIDPDALKIMYRMIQHGFKSYLVGGGVRDLLLGKEPKDFDIATDARPRQVKALFRNSRIIGRRFKLVHIFFGNQKIIEVATFRDFQDDFEAEEETEAGKTAGQARDNKFGTEATDAQRRDITINGLFYDLSTFSIIDYVGGVQDLRDGIIRVVGDPRSRFEEDPVRLVRVVRHAARTGFRIEESARAAMLSGHDLVDKSVAVRLYVELQKDLTSGYCLKTFRMMHEMLLLPHFLPEISPQALAPGSHLSHALFRYDLEKKEKREISCTAVLSTLALASVLGPVSTDALIERIESRATLQEILASSFPRLAVPRKERDRIAELLLLWFSLRSPNGKPPRQSSIAKVGCFHDLRLFSAAMGNSERDHDLIEMLDNLAQNAPEPDSRERAPEKRRRRRRRKPSPDSDDSEDEA